MAADIPVDRFDLEPDSAQTRQLAFLNRLRSARQLEEFYATSNLEFVDRAIEAAHESVAQEKHVDGYTSLGAALRARFYHAGADIKDLDSAVDSFKNARTLAVGAEQVGRAINNLSGVLHDRFKARRSIDDLQQAIRFSTEAIEIAHDQGTHAHPLRYNNLGNQLRDRYHVIGAIDDLVEAIRQFSMAVNAGQGDADIGDYQNDLGTAFMDRYILAKDVSDLVASYNCFAASVKSRGSTSSERFMCLSNLCDAALSLHVIEKQRHPQRDLLDRVPDFSDASVADFSVGRFLKTALWASRLAIDGLPMENRNFALIALSRVNAIQCFMEKPRKSPY